MLASRNVRKIKGLRRTAYWIVAGCALVAGCTADNRARHAPRTHPDSTVTPPTAEPASPAPAATQSPAANPQPPQPAAQAPVTVAQQPAASGATQPAVEPPQEAVSNAAPPASADESPDVDADALAEQIRAQVAAIRAARKTDQPEPAVQPSAKEASSPAAAREPAATRPAPPTADQPAAGTDTGAARMELAPAEFNFGEIWQGAAAEREFTIKNSGTAPLTLSTQSSCGCTVASRPKTPLPPGESTAFKITYNTSHPGAAQKKVTVTSNDPNQLTLTINVTGTVKPLVAITPLDRVIFRNANPDAAQSQTLTLESRYDGPLYLRLKEGQSLGNVDASLREVERGKRYELTVTTKPPLKSGPSNSTVVLETGLPEAPTVPVAVSVQVPARVSVVPTMLSVPAGSTKPSEQIVRVQYWLNSPVTVTAVKPSVDSIKCEILPPTSSAPALPAPASSAPASRLGQQEIRLTLPPADQLPPGGGTIEILTDDPSPQYQKFQVRILVPRPAARQPTTKPLVPTTAPAGRGSGSAN